MNLHFVLGMAAGWLLLTQRTGGFVLFCGAVAAAGLLVVAGSTAAIVTAFAVSVLVLSRYEMSSMWRGVVGLGDSSYSLYLFHPFIAPALVVLLSSRLGLASGLAIGLTCFFTVLLSHLLHLAIERPVITLVREKLRTRRLA